MYHDFRWISHFTYPWRIHGAGMRSHKGGIWDPWHTIAAPWIRHGIPGPPQNNQRVPGMFHPFLEGIPPTESLVVGDLWLRWNLWRSGASGSAPWHCLGWILLGDFMGFHRGFHGISPGISWDLMGYTQQQWHGFYPLAVFNIAVQIQFRQFDGLLSSMISLLKLNQWPFQEPIDWRYLPYIRPIF